jgi:CRISPR-associated endonuclease/helicase Cas3
MPQKFYAHSLSGRPPEEWQPLEEHLKNVAEMARRFAEPYGGGDWAYMAGLWHDLGKYSCEFQNRLLAMNDPEAHIEAKPGRPDHSTAGAQHVSSIFNEMGKIIAYTIAGHHAGLPDGKTNDASCLYSRLQKKIPDYSCAPIALLQKKLALQPPFALSDQKRFSFQLSFLTRMIYSCLVDADFLDTEKFLEPDKSSWRQGYPSLEVLERNLQIFMDDLVNRASPTKVNEERKGIFENCLKAAELEPGLFSLTVPTGGGKTLSSLAFAFRHAIKYNLKRVIYVIPYTSIIEQNADIFRRALGENAVIEHHSNFDPPEEDRWSRLASENWDAPVIVTTNVQFFESLFSVRSSRCRKLHNIAQSLVILDEAQMLPVSLLKPCLEAIKDLASHYGTTIILCTATQPALSKSSEFRDGLEGVREIIPDPVSLYQAFKKVKVDYLPTLSNQDLANRILEHKQALTICNTRRQARETFELILPEGGVFHLSALMCPAHRTAVLDKIRQTLKIGQPCRVVSTQLIEAGVDIDFPVVFRSIAGIDSIAQAAGRCNREGLLPGMGQVFIFTPDSGLPPGYFRQTAQTAQEVMRHHQDPLSLKAVEEYFQTLYWLNGDNLDEFQILRMILDGIRTGDYPFRAIAQKFKIIQDHMQSIIIPWNEKADSLIKEIRYTEYPGATARKAQRFTIQVPPRTFYDLLNGGAVERIHERYNILTNKDIYRQDLGLCPEDPSFHEVESLMV